MEVSKENQELLTRYLLGLATAVEQTALEDRYAADPHIFEQLVASENELTDRYWRDELPAAERATFERHVLAHPRRRARAQIAETLVNQLSQAAVTESHRTPRSLSERIMAWWRSPNDTWRLALSVTTASLLLVLGGWWLLRMLRPPEPTQTAHNPGQQATPQVTPTLASTPIAMPSATPASAGLAVPAFVTFTLQAGTVRGSASDDTPVLTIPPATTEVRLRLKAETSAYARYRLTIQRADGRALHTQTVTTKSDHLAIALPVRIFTTGEYVIALSGLNPDGEVDALSKTVFRVIKK